MISREGCSGSRFISGVWCQFFLLNDDLTADYEDDADLHIFNLFRTSHSHPHYRNTDFYCTPQAYITESVWIGGTLSVSCCCGVGLANRPSESASATIAASDSLLS